MRQDLATDRAGSLRAARHERRLKLRYGVIADVHGNLPALEAVLARLEGERLNGLICAGDLVGYGPFPNECVARLSAVGALCVAGNHDLMALGRLSDKAVPPLTSSTLAWTRQVLTPAAREYLEQLPLLRCVGQDTVVAHGSPEDPCEYVADARAARDALSRLREPHPAARVLIVGHTHRAMAHGSRRGVLRPSRGGVVELAPDEPTLLNPGSVGQSRDRRAATASALVLDLGAGTATFHAVDYDLQASRRALRAAGLPQEAIHMRPSIRAVTRRRLGSALRPAIAALRSRRGGRSPRA